MIVAVLITSVWPMSSG